MEVASAEESLRIAEGRHRAGLGTFLELVDAQPALNTARVNQVNARAARSIAAASLRYQLGQTPEAAARTPARPTEPFTRPPAPRP